MTKCVVLLIALGAAVGGFTSAAAAPAAGAPSGLTFDATGEVLYDSNQLRSLSQGQAHKDDFRYSPAGSVEYDRAVGRTTLSVNGLIGHDFFQYNSYLNRNRFAGGGTLSATAGSSCVATVNGNYSNRQNGIRSFGDTGPAAPTTGDLPPDDVGQLIDNRQIFTTYGGNASCGGAGGRLSFGGAANHSSLSNGAVSRKFADSNTDVFSLFAGLGVLRPGQLQLNGSFSTINYPNRLNTPGVPPALALNSGVKTYRIGLNYSRPIGTKLSGSIGASYLTARPDGPQSPYSSPAYNISLSYIPGTKLTFSILGSRNIIASSTAGALYRVVDQIDLNAIYHIGETITAHANAGFTSNNYKEAFAIPGQPVQRTDSSKIFGIGANYAPRPLYDLSFLVSQTIRTANPSVYNYNSTRVSLTLAVHI